MSALEVIDGFCTDCGSWTKLHNSRCACGSGRVAIPPAGYTIIRDDENHKATVERCARVIDDFQEVVSLSTNARFLIGRTEGNLVGTAYAQSLRSLIKEDGE